jgi:hypothetical protein
MSGETKLRLLRDTIDDVQGAVGPPLLLWLLGVPLSVVVVLWLLFFRG